MRLEQKIQKRMLKTTHNKNVSLMNSKRISLSLKWNVKTSGYQKMLFKTIDKCCEVDLCAISCACVQKEFILLYLSLSMLAVTESPWG